MAYARGVLAWLAVAAAVALAPADDPDPRSLARRTAEADAFRQLRSAVLGLRIGDGLLLADYCAQSYALWAAVDAAVSGAKVGEPIWRAEGRCEIPIELPLSDLADQLRSAHEQVSRELTLTELNFDGLAAVGVLRVTGVGVAREELPPGLPGDVVERLGLPPGTTAGAAPPPDYWREAGPQARRAAIRAARLDALRRLTEVVQRLRLTPDVTVRDLLPAGEAVAAELSAGLRGAREVGRPYLHDDAPIAEVRMAIGVDAVIEAVRKLNAQGGNPRKLPLPELEAALRRALPREIEALGVGVPPRNLLASDGAAPPLRLPPWATDAIQATGTGADVELSTPLGRLRAARAAESDARRRLADQIDTLELAPGRRVQTIREAAQVVSLQMDALLAGAIVVRTEFQDDKAVVTVQVQGMQVWDLCSGTH